MAIRDARLHVLGPRPPWWRPLRRREWTRLERDIHQAAAFAQIQGAYQAAFANLMEQVTKAFVTVKVDATGRDEREMSTFKMLAHFIAQKPLDGRKCVRVRLHPADMALVQADLARDAEDLGVVSVPPAELPPMGDAVMWILGVPISVDCTMQPGVPMFDMAVPQ